MNNTDLGPAGDDPPGSALPPADAYSPAKNPDGTLRVTREEYLTVLNKVSRKDPLRNACRVLQIPVSQSAKLQRLREVLCDHWFPNHTNPPVNVPDRDSHVLAPTLTTTPHPLPTSLEQANVFLVSRTDNTDDEVALVEEYGLGIEGAASEEVLAYDDEELDGADDGDNEFAGDSDEEDRDDHEIYKTRIRVEETQRAEGNRRAGGLKTQKAVVKAVEEFRDRALDKGEILDEIIDEHYLLLFIRFSAERNKRNRKGVDIPGTYIGASHIKKLYFGALRMRKEQDARDPKLKEKRPATSIHVWDTLKSRMNEALERTRNGLMEGEDAPDIVANTFLSSITEVQMARVGQGFLAHRELRSVVNGHLAWTCQNASGNRGDDFRALKLCELQPHLIEHPADSSIKIFAVLGLQGEEKAGANRGLRTKINPVYTTFIAHRDPKSCPLGAMAFYLHYIHDVRDIAAALDIDWSWNTSWRQIRVLHSQKSPSTPYHEQSLYNLYVKAFDDASFISKSKAHLPRHNLPYRQERLGVDPLQTSRLGWQRGTTFLDTYAPGLAKDAVLGAHGYKVYEPYDPVWQHVNVPQDFLMLMCPNAEQLCSQVEGRENLIGTTNHFKMIMALRPYLFQCGAAIFQDSPNSNLFKLPAFKDPRVLIWMKTTFRVDYAVLQAKAGNSVDLQRLADDTLRNSLAGIQNSLHTQNLKLESLEQKIERRTAVLSPSKSYSAAAYTDSFYASSSQGQTTATDTCNSLMPAFVLEDSEVGVYALDPALCPEEGDSGFRAFVNESPKAPTTPRAKTQVDLVLPPVVAFSKPGGPQFLWPPVLGQRSITWDQVFPLIMRPEMLWDCWKPSKTLDKMTLEEVWQCFNSGERVFNTGGMQTGVKPPLRQVEQFFQSKWRNSITARKAWQRFREIPDYIEAQSALQSVSPNIILSNLKLQLGKDGKPKGPSALSADIKRERERLKAIDMGLDLEIEIPSLSTPPLGEPSPTIENKTESVGKKRKKPSIDPRRRPPKTPKT